MRHGILITLAILLAVAGCAPSKFNSEPSPITMTILPNGMLTPSGNAMIVRSAPIGVCLCPTGVVTPPQTQGVISPPPVICNCPAILVTESVQPTDESTTEKVITLQDNGETITLHSGETFLLDLGTNMYDWTVDIDTQSVLSRVINIMVIRGAQGIYKAHNPGTAILTATGDPLCRKTIPICAMPSLLFKLTAIVQ